MGRRCVTIRDRHPLAAVDVLQEVEHRCFAGDVHAHGRFVEHEHVGRAGQRPCQQHALLLAGREIAKQLPAKRLDAEQRQRVQRGPAICGAGAVKGASPRREPHLDDLERRDGHDDVDALALRHVADDRAGAPLHAPRKGCQEPEHRLEQRALAGAVRANDAQDLAAADGEREVVEERAPPVAEREMLPAQHPLSGVCRGHDRGRAADDHRPV